MKMDNDFESRSHSYDDLGSIIVEYSPQAESDRLESRNIPESVERELQKAVLSLTGESNRRIIVKGTSGSGKSYFISQLIYRMKDLSKTDNKFRFIYLNRLDTMKYGDDMAGFSRALISSIKKKFKIKDENVCIITDDPDAAGFISSLKPDVRVILEVDSLLYRGMMNAQKSGRTNVWSQWDTVDVMDFFIVRSDLTRFVHRGLLKRLTRIYGNDFPERHVREHFNFVLKLHPEFYVRTELDEKSVPEKGRFSNNAYSKIPFGFWAIFLRKYIGLKSISDKDTEDSILIDEVYSSIHGLLEDVKEDMDYKSRETVNKWTDEVVKDNRSTDKDLVPEGFFFIDEDSALQEVFDLSEGIDDLFPFNDSFTREHLEEFLKEVSRRKDRGDPFKEAQREKGSEDPKNSGMVFKDMSTLKQRIEKSIKGQSRAVEKIVDSVSLPASGLNDPRRPMRVMLFLGPTGVGKTETSIKLAEELKVEPMNVIRLDMSEYSTKYEATRLFGSSPGYVGYSEEGGTLTGGIIKNPNSLIILDEVEKADPLIWDSFLQIFDAGRMTTGSGKVADFTESIIVMTSNLGADEIRRRRNGVSLGSSNSEIIGISEIERTAKKAMEDRFRPEFINRIDDFIVFEEITEDVALKIIELEISKYSERLKKTSGSEIKVSSSRVLKLILKDSEFSKYGARSLKRDIADMVLKPLTKKILASEDSKGRVFVLGVSNGKLTIRVKDSDNER